MPNVQLVQTYRPAAALLHPLRRRILEQLREPDSASGLARRLALPRQRLNYHLRSLEKHGFLELVEERRKGNCVERLLRATARAFVISPEALGALGADPADVEDRFSSSYLVAVAARAIRDIGLLRPRAEKAGKRLGTFTLQGQIRLASAAQRKAFMEELTNEVARLTAKYHDELSESGRGFQFFIAGYPAVKEIEETEDAG
ncbi:MAG TPA: helix-turn-helix domain-containing protein [Candidatus Polarisedimenticolia bacterium]|nr:helix-turn-helix domain-containing protein [Candidatus Polarisedimenticolia bacterium]